MSNAVLEEKNGPVGSHPTVKAIMDIRAKRIDLDTGRGSNQPCISLHEDQEKIVLAINTEYGHSKVSLSSSESARLIEYLEELRGDV